MGEASRKMEPCTYAQWLTWPEGEPVELIEGEVHAMTPAPGRRHQEVLLELARQVADALEGGPCRAYIAPFAVRLPAGDEADEAITTVVQPDLSVVCDPAQLDQRGCRGAPTLVVEILSPASAYHDLYRKRDLYEAAGVPEYWIVHPGEGFVMRYVLHAGRYGEPVVEELVGESASVILPQVRVLWARVLR